MTAQHSLDLAQLDAHAADLHLLVDAAEDIETAVVERADQVAGAVEPLSRPAAPGIRDEADGAQLGTHVMHGQEQEMILGPETQQGEPQQRNPGQVEGPPGLFGVPPPELGLAPGSGAATASPSMRPPPAGSIQ